MALRTCKLPDGNLTLCHKHLSALFLDGSLAGSSEADTIWAVDVNVGDVVKRDGATCDACDAMTPMHAGADALATLEQARAVLWPNGETDREWGADELNELGRILQE